MSDQSVRMGAAVVLAEDMSVVIYFSGKIEVVVSIPEI